MFVTLRMQSVICQQAKANQQQNPFMGPHMVKLTRVDTHKRGDRSPWATIAGMPVGHEQSLRPELPDVDDLMVSYTPSLKHYTAQQPHQLCELWNSGSPSPDLVWYITYVHLIAHIQGVSE